MEDILELDRRARHVMKSGACVMNCLIKSQLSPAIICLTWNKSSKRIPICHGVFHPCVSFIRSSETCVPTYERFSNYPSGTTLQLSSNGSSFWFTRRLSTAHRAEMRPFSPISEESSQTGGNLSTPIAETKRLPLQEKVPNTAPSASNANTKYIMDTCTYHQTIELLERYLKPADDDGATTDSASTSLPGNPSKYLALAEEMWEEPRISSPSLVECKLEMPLTLKSSPNPITCSAPVQKTMMVAQARIWWIQRTPGHGNAKKFVRYPSCSTQLLRISTTSSRLTRVKCPRINDD